MLFNKIVCSKVIGLPVYIVCCFNLKSVFDNNAVIEKIYQNVVLVAFLGITIYMSFQIQLQDMCNFPSTETVKYSDILIKNTSFTIRFPCVLLLIIMLLSLYHLLLCATYVLYKNYSIFLS